MLDLMTGNAAAAKAAMLARVEVIAAYPITPQTSISEKLAEMVANGEMGAKYIKVESEHSAMAALIGASYIGARTFTATSSQGLALMHEMLFWAAGARRPIVMPVVSRALGPPWNIWTDHMDVMGERDTGWMQLFCENNQETLDLILMAYRVAEDKDIMLPAMIIEDGFILSHTFEKVDVPAIEEVDFYLHPFNPDVKINFRKPRRYGSLVMPDWAMEFRYNNALAMEKAKKKWTEAGTAFKKAFGRDYTSLVELYRCEDADVGKEGGRGQAPDLPSFPDGGADAVGRDREDDRCLRPQLHLRTRRSDLWRGAQCPVPIGPGHQGQRLHRRTGRQGRDRVGVREDVRGPAGDLEGRQPGQGSGMGRPQGRELEVVRCRG
jgi:hypothetical protein